MLVQDDILQKANEQFMPNGLAQNGKSCLGLLNANGKEMINYV